MRRAALLLAAVCLGGCTLAYVKVQHDRPSRLDRPPDTTLSIGAQWNFWDAQSQWLVDKIKAALKEEK